MSTDLSTLRASLRAHGTDLATAKKDNALDALLNASARLTQLVDDGKIPSAFVTQLAEWVDETADSAEAGRPGPQITNIGSSTKDSVKPEHRRVIQALDRGELKLDPSTGLPETADSSAEVDNVLTALERKLSIGKVGGDSNTDRQNRILAEIDNLKKTATDQLGEVAEAVGLKKDAKPADIVAAAKSSKEDQDAIGDIAEAHGLDKGANTADIVAAAKAAKTGTPVKTTSRLRIPGRS